MAQGGAPAGGAAGGAAASSSMNRNIARDTSPLNPENSLELIKPVDKSEESAFRDFQRVSPEDMPKKIELGEKFLKKYPKSNYRAIVYSGLTSAYLMTNQVEKMEESGEMALALNPKDVLVLAMLGQTIPRTITASTPDPQKQLEKAEQYAKQAIEQDSVAGETGEYLRPGVCASEEPGSRYCPQRIGIGGFPPRGLCGRH